MIPLFIGGTGRSGTTICQDYLSKNSLVHGSQPEELRILTEQYGLIDLYYKEDLESFLFYLRDHWLLPTDKTRGIYCNSDPEKINSEIKELKNNFLINKRKAIYNFYQKLFINQYNFDTNCLYLADSTPSNIKYADKILEIFGDAKFINMVRDGRDVAYSIFQMKDSWALEKRNSELDALDWWYNRIIDSNNALSKIPNNYYINIRLEDFVTKKEERKKMLSFLSLYQDNNMSLFLNNSISIEKVNFGKWKNLDIAKKIDEKYTFMLKKLNDQGIVIERYY
jgi:hypothetical protein